MTGSTRCWHCGRPLSLKPNGERWFDLIKDQLGNDVRVHKICKPNAARQSLTADVPHRQYRGVD